MEARQYDVSPGSIVSIRATKSFTVVAIDGQGEVHVLAPDRETDRKAVFVVPEAVDSIEVETDGMVSIKETPSVRRQEKVDRTRLELNMEKPLSIREEIAKYVGEYIRLQRQHEEGEEYETFEEANDFEDFDPDDVLISPYEVTPMQDEYFDEDRRRVREAKKEKKSQPAPLPEEQTVEEAEVA